MGFNLQKWLLGWRFSVICALQKCWLCVVMTLKHGVCTSLFLARLDNCSLRGWPRSQVVVQEWSGGPGNRGCTDRCAPAEPTFLPAMLSCLQLWPPYLLHVNAGECCCSQRPHTSCMLWTWSLCAHWPVCSCTCMTRNAPPPWHLLNNRVYELTDH